jgi:hypothetical protein
MRAMTIRVGIIFLLFLCFGCFSDNEKTQYIAIKSEKILQPYAKVTYKIFVDRGEVVYWIEPPGVERFQLHKLKNCIVADLNNWEGEAEYILLWKTKVKFNNGKFSSLGEGLANIDWFDWHFKTDPRPSSLFAYVIIIGFCLGILLLFAVYIAIEDQRVTKMNKRMVAKIREISNKKISPQMAGDRGKGIKEKPQL